MALPVTAPVAGFQGSGFQQDASAPTNNNHKRRASWDDDALTENLDTEADVSRMMAVDEELRELEDETTVSYHEEVLETLKLLMSGGIAGALSKTATAPLARLTILQQVEGLSNPTQQLILRRFAGLGVLGSLRQIIQREGVKALWKGNGVTIIHRLPYSATNFWVYENVNELWKQHIPSRGPLAIGDVSRRLVSGGIAGMSACSLAYPLDLIRTRLAAQTTTRYYRGINHALATIIRDEGVFGLYRGLSATLIQVAPSLAINYASYETARSFWLSHTELANPTVPMSLACGSVAGLVSSTATFPLDLVRRRMQLQGQGGGAAVYDSYLGAFRHIIAREGFKGLYAGILPEYYKVVPGVAIAFCTYELMKKSLGVKTNAAAR